MRWPENDAESTGKPKLNDVFVQIQYQGDDKFRLLVQYWVNYGGAYGMTQVSAIKTIAAVNEPLGNIHSLIMALALSAIISCSFFFFIITSLSFWRIFAG